MEVGRSLSTEKNMKAVNRMTNRLTNKTILLVKKKVI